MKKYAAKSKGDHAWVKTSNFIAGVSRLLFMHASLVHRKLQTARLQKAAPAPTSPSFPC